MGGAVAVLKPSWHKRGFSAAFLERKSFRSKLQRLSANRSSSSVLQRPEMFCWRTSEPFSRRTFLPRSSFLCQPPQSRDWEESCKQTQEERGEGRPEPTRTDQNQRKQKAGNDSQPWRNRRVTQTTETQSQSSLFTQETKTTTRYFYMKVFQINVNFCRKMCHYFNFVVGFLGFPKKKILNKFYFIKCWFKIKCDILLWFLN